MDRDLGPWQLYVTRCPQYRTAARKGNAGRCERWSPGGSSDCGSLQQLQQSAMHALVSGNDMALLEHGLAAVEIGDETAGLTHQQQPRSHVPRGKIAFPIAVEPPRGHPGEIERGRSEAPQSADLALYRRDLVTELRKIAAPVMRQSAGQDGIAELPARRHPQAPIVHERAFAALAGVKLVRCRIVDEPGNDGAVARQRDGDCELRNAVQEIGGAVERVDDPAMGLVGTLGSSALLAEKAVAGARLGELRAQNFLGAPIRRRDEISRPLQRDLQPLDLAEVALEAARRIVRGPDHDVEKRGLHHDLRIKDYGGRVPSFPGLAPAHRNDNVTCAAAGSRARAWRLLLNRDRTAGLPDTAARDCRRRRRARASPSVRAVPPPHPGRAARRGRRGAAWRVRTSPRGPPGRPPARTTPMPSGRPWEPRTHWRRAHPRASSLSGRPCC